jgi:hypothetical protein
LVVVLAAATDEVVWLEPLEPVEVAMDRVVDAAVVVELVVVSSAVAFLLPQVAAALQALWPSASLG